MKTQRWLAKCGLAAGKNANYLFPSNKLEKSLADFSFLCSRDHFLPLKFYERTK
jgi:hypothetical protein